MNTTLTGLVAAPFTPFRASGELDLPMISRLAGLLINNGVSGAFVCGTTGEGPSMTLGERKEVVQAWRTATVSRLKIVVHVGHLVLEDSCTLARHAQECGADAIASIAPSFFKPAGTAELVKWCQDIAAAAPALPFYYYHMPAMTGVNISVTDFLQQAEGRIPTLAGVKFTHEDLYDYGRASQLGGGRYAMLFGRDEILLAGLAMGMAGAVGSTYNYAAPIYRKIMAAFAAGDIATARSEQMRVQQFIAFLHEFGGLAAGKAIMKLIGYDCGPVRLPMRTLEASRVEQLRVGLQKIGFFEYCSTAEGRTLASR